MTSPGLSHVPDSMPPCRSTIPSGLPLNEHWEAPWPPPSACAVPIPKLNAHNANAHPISVFFIMRFSRLRRSWARTHNSRIRVSRSLSRASIAMRVVRTHDRGARVGTHAQIGSCRIGHPVAQLFVRPGTETQSKEYEPGGPAFSLL